jgi:hypothetical protein
LHGQAYGYAWTVGPRPTAEMHLTLTWSQPIIYVNSHQPR